MLCIRFDIGSSLTHSTCSGTLTGVNPESTIRDVLRKVEGHLLSESSVVANASVAFLPSKSNRALPPHEPIGKYFTDEDALVIVGDVHKVPVSKAAEAPERKQDHRVPVTILTGFLGSGKTTMLNHILREQQDRKVAVIENEYGEVPIDNEILNSNAQNMAVAEQVVVLENGCMCCQVRGDILGAFEQIATTIDGGNHLDAVIVETTGMADPVPIVRTFLQTPAICERFRLDGVVTLVDVKHLLARLREMDVEPTVRKHDIDPTKKADKQEDGGSVSEAFQQIMFADKIVLNKLDLVDPPTVVEVWSRVRGINATAKVQSCVKGQLDPDDLTNLYAFDMNAEDMNIEIQVEERQKACDGHDHGDCDHDHDHDHDHCDHENCDHGNHRHGNDMSTFSIIESNKVLKPLEFARWLRVLATLPPEKGNLYRGKGIFAVRGTSKKLIYHAVGDVMDKQYVGEWGDEEPSCKIVFIGRELDREWLEAGYRGCIEDATELERELRIATTSEATPGIAKTALAFLCPFLHTVDWANLGMSCKATYQSVFLGTAAKVSPHDDQGGAIWGVQSRTSTNDLFLHPVAPMSVIRAYMQAFRVVAPEILSMAGLAFQSTQDVEALGITMLEAAELHDKSTKSFLLDFKWRPETIVEFLKDPGNSTSSSMLRVEYEVENDEEFDYDDEVDMLKFKLQITPDDAASELRGHRLCMQVVGGKSCSQVYQLSFHTINPMFQVHIPVEDHRAPFTYSKESFHKWHPLMEQLKRNHCLRFLVRMKPDGSGPLGDMCGCC